MPVTLAPATALDDDALAELFTAVYAGYWHPIEIDATALRRMVSSYDLDLEASVVALDGRTPVGLAMLAIRGAEAWVGGMGVLPDRRREGTGELLTRHLVDAARDRGVRRVRLEVLVQKAPAQAVYRRLGFEQLRDVAVWLVDSPPEAQGAVDAGLDEALAVLADAETDAPWQRSLATVSRMRAHGSPLRAAAVGRGRAVLTLAGERASLLLLTAADSAEAAALIAHAFAQGATSLLWVNGPVDGVGADALREAGATPVGLQHELALDL
jgi:ribosomal protein S18 acetylase RimI-like enzyme